MFLIYVRVEVNVVFVGLDFIYVFLVLLFLCWLGICGGKVWFSCRNVRYEWIEMSCRM